jgi:hypothetical protein
MWHEWNDHDDCEADCVHICCNRIAALSVPAKPAARKE